MKLFFQIGIFLSFTGLLAGCASPAPVVKSTPTVTPSPTRQSTMTPEPSSTMEPGSSPVPASTMETGLKVFYSEKAQRDYLLFLPAEYGKDPQKQWPLILFLHSAGTRANNIEYLKYEALPQVLSFTPDFPSIVLMPYLPNVPDEDFWVREKVTRSVFTLLDEIQSAYAVDPKRVYLTGVSLGGNGTWAYGLLKPDRFAALVPVMGFIGNTAGVYVPENICDLKDVPVWAFHGAKDTIVPLEAEQMLVDALKDCGGNVRFTVYPDGDHDISGRVYNNNPELVDWLLSQSLK